MANIPSANNILPGVVTNVITQSTGASVPGGARITCIIGEGARQEIIVASAVGGGNDGLDGYYTSTNGSDGRHFLLQYSPIISNREQLYKNGRLLQGLEQSIDQNPFPFTYDYRIDISNGQIELQQAHLVDQGGTFYLAGASNVGVGTIQNLSLVDVNAPNETWTIKCVSVQRNNLNQPIAGTAQFVAFGSVSGNVLDANGNPTVWIANNQTVSNSILMFSISETMNGPTTISPFRPGDYFTVQVSSGVLTKNDSLTATYIAVSDINSPTFFTSVQQINTKHGLPSLTNTLSLGCQLAFANSPPGIMCLQAAPPLPRRISYVLETSFPATSTNVNDFIVPLPLGVSPDPNSNIDIFVTNPATGVETQLLANKFTFFTLGDPGQPTISEFVFDNALPPAGNSYSYSVTQTVATLNFGQDGYINRDLTTQINALFSSSITFDSTYIGKELSIIDAVNNANVGIFAIVGVVGGKLEILANSTPPFADFINDPTTTFQLIDPIFGEVVAGSVGSDGALIAIPNTGTGTLSSISVNFNPFNVIALGLKLQITASADASNIGIYDITSYNSGSNTLSISKTFISEHNLKYEVLDPSQTSDYLVLNHNIVPNNNSLRVTIVDIQDSTFFDAGWETALATLEAQELDILVPLPLQTISAIFQNSLNHCIAMSNPLNRKERVLFIGAINGLTPSNLTGATLAAVENLGVLEGIQGNTVAEVLAGDTEDLANYSVSSAYGETYRAVYFWPDQIVVQVGGSNQIIDGFYIAAAAAGYTSGSSNIAQPLTNKNLSGFTIQSNRMVSSTVLSSLTDAGVAPLQPVAGGGTVLWGITTSQSGAPEEQEISIVFIRDRLAKAMRSGFKEYIGTPENSDTQATLLTRAIALLRGFQAQGLITQYTEPTVVRDSVEPRQWDITVQVQPTYPIDWIYITVSVGIIA
jgi:hypothetical protein